MLELQEYISLGNFARNMFRTLEVSTYEPGVPIKPRSVTCGSPCSLAPCGAEDRHWSARINGSRVRFPQVSDYDHRIKVLFGNIKNTFREFDADGSGTMQWPQFKKAIERIDAKRVRACVWGVAGSRCRGNKAERAGLKTLVECAYESAA
eukprot:4950084-Pyramimonas_sp.AAC.3